MQNNFDIEIPKFLILDEEKKHNSINYDLLEGKIIIGLCGYAKSGKDAIANRFIKNYNFHRVAFADNVKKEMNQYLRELIYENINFLVAPSEPAYLKLEDIDFTTEDLNLKPRLRPYIIWYAELMRELNGLYYWINRAFENDAKGHERIVLSDIRRMKELDIFEGSNSFHDKSVKSLGQGNYFPIDYGSKIKSYGSLLFHVCQLNLTDSDILTKETIIQAHERWLFDDTFYIDSRLPEESSYRKIALDHQVKNLAEKFKIKKEIKPKNKQTTIFGN